LQGVSRDAAYCWVAQITNAIRMEDLSHPVVSGMHGLRPEGAWTPEDQGELLDVLCTHPYPIFTPHCDTDPINEMKTILHATCETLMYHDLSGGKDSFIEEAGTLGPMIAEDSVAADYIRASMFSSWAHDLRGFIWWCANEQSALAHTPYDWCSVERELGLFRLNGEKKPVLNEMTKFTDFVDTLATGKYIGEEKPFKLPEPIKDAVCILTEGQDQWAAAFGTFLLAKQAGLDITFAWQNDEIPDSPAYIIPSITGSIGIRRHTMNLLIDRVKNGAKLYLSLSEALLSPFNEITGVKVRTRSRRVREDVVRLDGYEFRLWNNMKYALASIGADVIAADANGEPVFTEYALGKGKVYFCAFPIEMDASCKNGVISGQYAIPYYRFYKKLDMRNPLKTASCDCPYYSLTEHILDNGRLVTVLNCTPEDRSELVRVTGEFVREINCQGGKCEVTADGVFVTLPANSGITFMTK